MISHDRANGRGGERRGEVGKEGRWEKRGAEKSKVKQGARFSSFTSNQVQRRGEASPLPHIGFHAF